MAVYKSYLNYLMELFALLGEVSSRAIFAGFGIFHERDMFALISDSTLFFKGND